MVCVERPVMVRAWTFEGSSSERLESSITTVPDPDALMSPTSRMQLLLLVASPYVTIAVEQ